MNSLWWERKFAVKLWRVLNAKLSVLRETPWTWLLLLMPPLSFQGRLALFSLNGVIDMKMLFGQGCYLLRGRVWVKGREPSSPRHPSWEWLGKTSDASGFLACVTRETKQMVLRSWAGLRNRGQAGTESGSSTKIKSWALLSHHTFSFGRTKKSQRTPT